MTSGWKYWNGQLVNPDYYERLRTEAGLPPEEAQQSLEELDRPPEEAGLPPEEAELFDLGLVLGTGVIGFGLLLTRISVFEGDYEMPLFAHHDEHGYCTEDVTFCRKVRARGHEIWVDHDLSRDVRHASLRWLGAEHMEAKP